MISFIKSNINICVFIAGQRIDLDSQAETNEANTRWLPMFSPQVPLTSPTDQGPATRGIGGSTLRPVPGCSTKLAIRGSLMYRQAEGDPEATIRYLKDSGSTNVVCSIQLHNSTSDRPSLTLASGHRKGRVGLP